MAGLRFSASLFVAAALAGAPASFQVGALSRAVEASPDAAAVAPTLTPDQTIDLARLFNLAPTAIDAGAGYGSSASDGAFDWIMAHTPLGGADFPELTAAAELYQKGDLSGGDAIARQVEDPLQRVALEWIALRAAPRSVGDARLAAFLAAHPRWPSHGWIVSFQEAALYGERAHTDVVHAAFAADPPNTPAGKLALATAERDAGRVDKAAALVRGLWRDNDLDGWLEGALLKDFGQLLVRADHQYRTERLLYAEKYSLALRAAALAGGDAPLLAKSWFAAARGALTQQALDALPPAVKSDPGLLYARIQGLRRADRVIEAALLMRAAPRDPAILIDGDRWWDERRMIARRLLDAGMAKEAYTLSANHSAVSIPARIEAEFHAGWIALRFLNDADAATRHFASAASIAQTPLAVARAAYWQGRAAEQLGRTDLAKTYFVRAASYPIAYYGQLAAEKLSRPALVLRAAANVAQGDARDEATKVVELLYAAKLNQFARSLAIDASRSFTDEGQLAGLAAVATRFDDAPATLEIGKQATMRGFALDDSAFPTFGVPSFTPLAGSADLAAVYSVARQESEFIPAAASGAGAKGLMQLMPATARDTAKRAGVPFDPMRLSADPAFNTQLGAAFLGQLLNDENGSAVLAFAAYNAGGGRVQQWIAAYGDPRLANVDPVDWVERIPFDETRDYVQRVMENLQVYRARFAEIAKANDTRAADRVARADE